MNSGELADVLYALHRSMAGAGSAVVAVPPPAAPPPAVPPPAVLRPAQPGKSKSNGGKSKGKGTGKQARSRVTNNGGRGKGRGKSSGPVNNGWDGQEEWNGASAPNSFYRRSNNRDYDPRWAEGWAPRQPNDRTRGHQRRGGRDERAGRDRARESEEYDRYCAERDRERAASRARRDNPY